MTTRCWQPILATDPLSVSRGAARDSGSGADGTAGRVREQTARLDGEATVRG